MIIAVFDALGLFFFGLALIWTFVIPNSRLDSFTRLLLRIFLAVYFFVMAGNMLEHMEITSYFDPFEDYFEILFLPFFMFFLFAYHTRLEINRRLETEKALSASEKLYRTLVENMNFGVTLIDKNHRILMTNANQGRLFHKDPADFQGKFCYQEFEGRQAVCPHCPGVRAMETGLAQEQITQGVREDGSRTHVLIRAFPLINSAGIADSFIELVEDIAERLQAEQSRRENEEKFRALFDLAPLAVALTELESGRLVDANKELCRITGFQREDLLGKTVVELGFYSEANRQEWVDALDKTGEVAGLEKTFSVLGRQVHAMMFSKVVRLHDTLFVITAFNDITEKKKLEEERKRIERIESLGLLAGGIAHDFNNILTGILGNISLAKLHSPPGQKIYEKLLETEKAALRARDLTLQLLTFSRGGEPIRRSESLSDLVKEACGFILSGSNVKAVYEFSDNLWPVEIDSGQVSQVLQNLAMNAIQAMIQGGTIRISAENITIGSEEALLLLPGRYVQLHFADDGPGIANEHLPHIFDPYFTTKQSGNGLGLTICYSIIKRHHGLLDVESSPGNGTTFIIYLPAAEAAPHLKTAVPELVRGSGRVLLVDDDETILATATDILTLLGYEVEAVRDGREAIESYRRALEGGTPFAAVIMDLTIPGGMGGKETIGKLLELDPRAKVLVSSGYCNDPVMANFAEYGFVGVIPKPYQIENLSQVLWSIL
ncbi:MAG: PAS domain-containing hybrid sensor histidine kinase/response regulator [Thermodesulfobacteriota bacterium]